MTVLNKILSTRVLLIVSIAISLNIFLASINLALEKETYPNVNEVVIRIEGMTCKVCSFTIKKALTNLSGVLSAKVSFKDKEAKVLYEDNKVTTTQIIGAIENAGNYKAVVIR